jgi:hypothetical protein
VRFAADPDQGLRQFERDAAVACGAMALIALVVERGRPDGAAGVVAGGALMALSYWAIKGGVDLVVARSNRAGSPALPADSGVAGPQPRPAAGLPLRRHIGHAVKFFTRYALLAVGAYVMLACFRVHPVGLLAGATTPFVAALAQVVRSSRAPSHRGQS